MNWIYPLWVIVSMTYASLLFSQESTTMIQQVQQEKIQQIQPLQPVLQVQYVSVHEVFPGQTRYSSHSVTRKVAKLIDKGAATWNETQKHWEYTYNDGTSVFSEKEALPVIRAPFGYVLMDGHHDILSSIQLKAETVPVRVIEDLSHLDVDQFWIVAEQKGWVYLYAKGGKPSSPCMRFEDLTDDPNRAFATLISHIYYPDPSGSYTSKGAEYPVWLKVGKDIPFIEFKIADALFAHDFIYQPEQMGHPPSKEVVEQARQILLEANIPGLRVVSNRVHYTQLAAHCESTERCHLVKTNTAEPSNLPFFKSMSASFAFSKE